MMTQTKEVNLVSDLYDPQEAQSVVCSFIDDKLRYYQTKRLCEWEKNHSSDFTEIDERISQLKSQKEDFIRLIGDAKASSKKININGVIDISLID